MSFEDPTDPLSPGWLVGGIGTNTGYILHTSAGGAAGTWTQSSCYEFLAPNFQLGLCGIPTQYGVSVLGAGDPQVFSGGYASNVMIREVGNANFDPCASPCEANVNPCGTNVPTWVERDASPVSNPCDGTNPPIFATARISNTQACMVGSFDRVQLFDHDATPPTPQIVEMANTSFTRLKAGEFINASKGCVAGQGLSVWYTSDGGQQWSDVTAWGCFESHQINGLDFSDTGSVAVAVGTAGFMARSTDFGQTWSTLPAQPPARHAVDFVSASTTVYAAGDGGSILKSSDDGATWVAVSLPPDTDENLFGVSFATPLVGYVVGENQVVFRTTDGGGTWNTVPVLGGDPLDDFFDVETWGDGTDAVLVGENGGYYERSGGRFVLQALGALTVTERLHDVEVFDGGDHVRIAGDNGVVLFRDFGSWTRPWSQTNSPIHELSFQNPDHGFAIGNNFVIAEYSGP